MNFNIYVNKEIAKRMERLSKMLHRSRNSIISEAIQQWLDAHENNRWPKGFFDFEPIKDAPNFEDLRKELKGISEDPLK